MLSEEVWLCFRLTKGAISGQPLLYREPGFPLSPVFNGKAVRTQSVLCRSVTMPK